MTYSVLIWADERHQYCVRQIGEHSKGLYGDVVFENQSDVFMLSPNLV
jgi:hypothetical protein